MWKSILTRTLLLFIVGFTLTLPFPYYILPDFGEFLRPLTEGLTHRLIGLPEDFLHSDSDLMIAWTVILFSVSLIFATAWTVIRSAKMPFLRYLLTRFSAYYLSLTLLIYGLNKVFNYQFFFPEPNTLFTPVGQLSPDILFWSSMGTSHSYSIFAGLIEVIPALLLLFPKTRMLGAFIGLGVLINVMMLNIGFDIDVKLFTAFLILLYLILLAPQFKRLFVFFVKNETVLPHIESYQPNNRIYKNAYPFLKPILIGLLLFESFGAYFETGEFNGDTQRQVYMQGAYQLSENPQLVERLFFHSQGYLILEKNNGHFEDYEMAWNGNKLILTAYDGRTSRLAFIKNSARKFNLNGYFFGNSVNWNFERIELEGLPIYG